MRQIIRHFITALGIGCMAALIGALPDRSARAQSQQAAPAPGPATQAPTMKQVALTDKQIESVLASQKDLDAVAEKLPENAAASQPDPKVMAQLDDVAKKYGFADYADYNVVIDNISLVLGGFDPQTKKYIGSEAVIKNQIAAVQADKKMPANDKKEAVADLNEALKTPQPAIENKGNIDLVGKYYDKLSAIMQEDDE